MKLTARRDPADGTIADARHRSIVVAGPGSYYPDVIDADQWRELIVDWNDSTGVLARVAVEVGPALQVVGRAHKCDHLPVRSPDCQAEVPDVWLGEGCGLVLVGLLSGDDGMPRLQLNVPRGRERAWLAHLDDTIARITRETVDAYTWHQ